MCRSLSLPHPMHTILIINGVLQWAFGLSLLALLIVWVFEYKYLPD